MKTMIVFLLSALFLNSCSTKNFKCSKFYDDISKSTSNEYFVQKYKDRIDSTINLTVENELYTLHILNIGTSGVSYRTTYRDDGGMGSSKSYEYHSNEVTSTFIFAFKNNQYYYSGFIYEFKRNTDRNINNLGCEISNYLSKGGK